MNKTIKFGMAWLVKFYDDLTSTTPSRTALVGAETEEDAAALVAPAMGLHMRADVVRVMLKPETTVPLEEVRWLD